MKRDCCGMLFDWLVERGLIGHVPRLQKALLGHGTKMLLMMAKMWEPGIRQLLMEEAKRKQSIWFGVICLSRLHPDAQMRCVSSWCVAFQLLGKVFLFAAGGGPSQVMFVCVQLSPVLLELGFQEVVFTSAEPQGQDGFSCCRCA